MVVGEAGIGIIILFCWINEGQPMGVKTNEDKTKIEEEVKGNRDVQTSVHTFRNYIMRVIGLEWRTKK